MEIIEKIKNLPLEENSSNIKYFQTLPKITKATVETFDVDYGTPQYHEAFYYNKYISDLIMQQQYSN